MDFIETIKKDKAYIKSKLIVKTWEKEFKLKNSRMPSKFDIKEAPPKIKYAYKKYFEIKTSALENSLSICDMDEEATDTLNPIVPKENFLFEANSPDTEEILKVLPSGPELENLLSNSKKRDDITHPFTENLSKKLFHTQKLSLRNPRKSSQSKQLTSENYKTQNSESYNKSTLDISNIDDTVHSQNSSTYNDTISLEFGRENFSTPSYTSQCSIISSQTKASTLRQLDTSWLNRAAELTGEHLTLVDSVTEYQSQKFGLGNINISSTNIDNDFVENSESEDNVTITKLQPALKKRKTNIACIENQSRHNISSEDETLHEIKINKEIKKKTNVSKIKKKNRKQVEPKHVLKSKETNEVQQPPDIKEYIPFSLDNDILPRYSEVKKIMKKAAPKKSNSLPNIDESLDVMENKIKLGTINDNFVKINIEKKVFVRGKKGINYSKYKKKQWKDKKALHASMEFPEAGKMLCFKCGQNGHMARYCTAHKGDMLIPLENITEEQLPTLEDVKNIANGPNPSEELPIIEQFTNLYESSQVPDSFMKLLAATTDNNNSDINPIYSNYDNALNADLHEDLNKFGYTSFRPGQEQAIKRILCGMSTLLILPTGGGKSLCYQFPAYMYSKYAKCISLVISPLVSLMEDQVLNVPEFLKAGCLHANQSPTQRTKIIECLKNGDLNVLLISPEALISGDNSSGFSGLFKALPPIAFACIDEAHCVSQWSHNFRPSYLMICRVLREKLKVKCILGLTATASQATINSVISHLNVPDGINGVITNPTLPDNLKLSVSFEKDKDRGLVSFLTSQRVIAFQSIIIYCIRRDECERVAGILRACLQESGKVNMEAQNKKRKRMSYIAEAYHAGMSAAQRKKIQKHFMDGTLRIIVATVAFGMGINKSDIRCIIHYNMPSSFESYVQEVGRAGRDGNLAVCHVFMNDSNQDKNELLKHIYANSIDRPTIRRLLEKVFIPCECGKTQKTVSCKGHEVGIPIDSTVEELDIPSENIATLLCYVELHPQHYIKLLNNAYTMCKISSYGGPQTILQAAKSCRPLAMAILLQSKNDPNVTNKSVLEFDVIDVASAIGCESGMVKYQLKNLEWVMESGSSRRSHLKVEFYTLGFRIKARGDLSPTELDNILDDLHKCVVSQEKTRLCQLEECCQAFKQLGDYSTHTSNSGEDVLATKSDELKLTIRKYFSRDQTVSENVKLEERPLDVDHVTVDVRSLISAYKDCSFTGRSIARIFQGISSPNYPAIVWGRTKYWRSHIHEDFNGIVKVATQQILQLK